MLPDFNRLKIFYFIYSLKSSAAAAKVLHITQSAVSQHLKNLETELNVTLFSRLHKRLVPTEAGMRLYRTVSPFLYEVEATIQHIHRSRKAPFGLLRIGAPKEFGETCITAILAAFHKTYPEVKFQLELGHPSLILPMIETGNLDLAFSDIYSDRSLTPRQYDLFDIKPVFTEELVLVSSRQYRRKQMKGDDLKNLINCSFIAYQKSRASLKSWFRYHYDLSNPKIDVVLVVENVRAVITAIRHAMGLGVVPSHLISSEIDKGRLVPIESGKPQIVNRISVVQLQDKKPTTTEKVFLSFCLDRLKKMV